LYLKTKQKNFTNYWLLNLTKRKRIGGKDIYEIASLFSVLEFQKSREFIKDWALGKRIENYVISANIEAVKKV